MIFDTRGKTEKPCQAIFIRQRNQWASLANPLIHPSARKVDLVESLYSTEMEDRVIDIYQNANKLWPSEIPACSRVEAERAAKRLARHFSDGPVRVTVRRCWVTTAPNNSLRRGWRRLVHDMSHRVRGRHSGWHARVEAEMVKYVLTQGWLTGDLKPKPKAPVDRVALRADRIEAAIIRWTAKLKRAETALRKLRRQQAYYQRKIAA